VQVPEDQRRTRKKLLSGGHFRIVQLGEKRMENKGSKMRPRYLSMSFLKLQQEVVKGGAAEAIPYQDRESLEGGGEKENEGGKTSN